jgi:DNA-directed RNA polymerase specialized sigma subunit
MGTNNKSGVKKKNSSRRPSASKIEKIVVVSKSRVGNASQHSNMTCFSLEAVTQMLDTATASYSAIVKQNLEQQEKLQLMTRVVKLMEDNYRTISCLLFLEKNRRRRSESDKPACPPSVVLVDEGAQN